MAIPPPSPDSPAAPDSPRAPEGSRGLAARYRGGLKKGRPLGKPDAWTILAAWGPCGFAPIAPGTFGTLGAVPLWWALSKAGLPAVLAVTVLLFLVAVPAATRAGRYWGVVDASPIVIDEVVGYLVAVAGLPFSWPVAVAAFALFRFFDILKPWPASTFDGIKSGFGVVMDDVAAGAWALVALHLGMWGVRALG